MIIHEKSPIDPKTKRLQFDTQIVRTILEQNPEQFHLACIIYYLHGAKTKQWAYSTNNLEVMKLLFNSLLQLNIQLNNQQKITFHCSYPYHSVSAVSKATDKKQIEDWVKQRWCELLPNYNPCRFTFNPRKNANQKQLQAGDTPGSLEIRLEKSMGAMLAFRKQGKFLIQKAYGGSIL